MLKELLAGYSAEAGRYDELLAEPGAPRPHWDVFLRSLAQRAGAGDIADTLALMEREIRENGITYNVYADPKGVDRPWEVDPLPLLIAPDEWRAIEDGIVQRAELLNRVLADVYGDQALLKSGAIPASVIFGHSGFLHPAQGIRPPGGVHLFHYAADLARSPDGRWWVVSDRTQAPSGAGYALENRLVVSRVFPQLFRELHVQHLAPFFAAMRDSLLRWAPKGDGTPLIALLTPGPYNETYFEHALLARYLGFALVEGSDLTVRDGKVWMKTVEGLKRVHAILRRQDDGYCDPLELRSDSALGVAGLTECARRGSVLVANSLGSGVLESGALLGYLPGLSEQLLGEPLKLPSVATWWLGEPAAFDDAWARLDQVLIKPLERSSRERAQYGADLDPDERLLLKAHVASRPQRYVAQEWVHVSQAPVLERGAGRRETLAARTVGLRVFAVATPDGYRVMPGGLTRVAGGEQPRVIAMQRGGRSKDTWVLSDAAENTSFSLLSTTVRPEHLVSSRANVSSRAAENLFWFGRYGERCEAAMRLLRVAIGALLDEADGADAIPALMLARRFGLVDAGDDGDEPALALLRAATHPEGALAERLRQLSRCAFNLRDRMSADHWRTINALIADPVFQLRPGGGSMRLPLALAWLDRAVTSMVTLSGFVLDGMTRGTGWRFLSMGRRIERLSNLSSALQVATREGAAQGLEWLLDWADSGVTYRSRYLVAPEWLPVLDLLVRDEAVPRSLAFQLKGLADYIGKLEATHGRFAGDVVAPGQAALAALTPVDLAPDSETLAALLDQLQRIAHTVSDEMTLKFFSHAASRSVLSLVA